MFSVNSTSGRGDMLMRRKLTLNRNQVEHFRQHPVIGQVFKRMEKTVIHRAETACIYAISVLQSRWPEAEAIIFSDISCSKDYIKYVIQGETHEYLKRLKICPL